MRRVPGFTLVELVASVGLATALMGIALPRLIGLLEAVRLAGAARTTAAALRLARGHAIAQSTSIEVRFDAVRRVCETRDQAGVAIATRALPQTVSFAALPARARIRFGALGSAENGTIRLAAGGREREVIVNQRGRVRVP
jgi:type IV fimbrial biogenesis protein FimT